MTPAPVLLALIATAALPEASGGWYVPAVGAVGAAVLVPTTRKPSPCRPTSSALPVLWNEPADMIWSIEPTVTPRPTCSGLVPPLAAVWPEPPEINIESSESNVVRCAL